MKLRDKFLMILVGIPSVAVILLLVVTIQVFVSDKKIFIFESQLQNAHVMASQILSNLKSDNVASANLNNLDLFRNSSYSKIFLFNNNGKILASSEQFNPNNKIADFLSNESLSKISDLTINEGSFEDNLSKNSDSMISFVRLNDISSVLLIQTPKASAFRASSVFILKGILTILGLILSSTFASIILSKNMTKNLTLLESSMNAFGKGQLTTQVNFEGKDEISKLGRYFNKMVLQISNLIEEQKEKIKLEYEMDMAGKLQESFFPNRIFDKDGIEFAGYYQASQKCSGDWWYYFYTEDYFVAFMGDVTGHGVKSALMTSASRSMFSYLENDFTDTAKAMSLLNHGFFAAANGELNMSALILKINLKTGEMEYTNASHDPAIIYSPINGDINLLDVSHGKRLGTTSRETYKKTCLTLEPGQVLFVYTDGLLEISNSKGRTFNDKYIIQTLKKISLEINSSLSYSQNEFQSKLYHFSNGLLELKDDLSYFFIRFQNEKYSSPEARSTHAS